jgi:hypothetical protein
LDALPNQSARGFYVEQIIKAQICRDGVIGIHPLPRNQTITRCTFRPGGERTILDGAMGKRERERDSRWFLLDPEIFNYPGVDMILITDNTLVGINVTIAKTHASLAPFFATWRPLAQERGLDIRGIFIAPNGFQHQEENVDTALLKDIYNELWQKIDPGSKAPDYTCKCTSGCTNNKCSCRKRWKLCSPQCSCHQCDNTSFLNSTREIDLG